jgi:hypothetical protein
MTPTRMACFGSAFTPDPNSLELMSSTPITSSATHPAAS